MKQIQNLLQIASSSNISVFLQGESGSGKEVAARFIHNHSKRSNGPFIALNCGAIAQNLAETILEGSRKGAFTGAINNQLGVVRAANGGTLFLDEIGEMPLEAQCKLLRILQERSVMPLGETAYIPVDFRLICATNRNLRQEVNCGRFREDLFFRLNVFPIKIPALRDRSDFEELAQSIWNEVVFNQEDCKNGLTQEELKKYIMNQPALDLSKKDLSILKEKNWPGNVRQLKNVLQRFALLQPYGISLAEILQEEFYETKANLQELQPFPTLRSYKVAPAWDILKEELEKNNWNKSITAQKLGISRGSLCYQVKKHGFS